MSTPSEALLSLNVHYTAFPVWTVAPTPGHVALPIFLVPRINLALNLCDVHYVTYTRMLRCNVHATLIFVLLLLNLAKHCQFTWVQGVRGSTTRTLRGDFPSPADPPGQSLGSDRLRDGDRQGIECNRSGHRAPRGCAQRFAVASRPGDFALPGPIEQGVRRTPCNPRPGLSRPGPRPVFRHRLRPQGDFGSPFGNPSTGAPRPRTRVGADGGGLRR